MPWGGFALALLLAAVLQKTLIWLVGPYGTDLFLTLALLLALSAQAHEARIASWITGFLQDLLGTGPMGLNALCLGFTGLLLTWLRGAGWVHASWTRWAACALAALPARIFYFTYLQFGLEGGARSVWRLIFDAAWSAALAAAIAALIVALPWYVSRRKRWWPQRR